jgi:membrane protease YdiL (CAAX protease family)
MTPPERRAALVALGVTTAVVGVALLAPLAYSDPHGLDPDDLRLSGVAAALCLVTYASKRLVAARPVALALAAITIAYSGWLAAPQFLVDRGAHLSGPALTFWASFLQFAITVGACVAARRLPPALRPDLRLRSLSGRAVLVTLGGIALLTLAALIVPATWLGREGLQTVATGPGGRLDMAWLGPADLLMATAQELQFRGLLLGALERVMPRGWANVLQALLFGLSHLAVLYQGPLGPFLPVTAAVGLLAGFAVQRTRSLWPVIAVHGLADAAIDAFVLGGLYGL